MGTVFTVEVDGEHDHSRIDDAFGWWREVEERFSTFRRDSEVSRIGRGELDPDDAHPDTRHVLSMCAELEQLTDGRFSIRPGRAGGPGLDPAAFVKGWSVDEASLILRAHRIDDFVIYAGGDVLCCGSPPDGEVWRIGIRDPSDPDEVLATLVIERGAVATSGAYSRGDHVWGADPGGVASVTVTGPSLGIADALATAAFGAGGDLSGWFERFDGYGAVLVRHDGSIESIGHSVLV